MLLVVVCHHCPPTSPHSTEHRPAKHTHSHSARTLTAVVQSMKTVKGKGSPYPIAKRRVLELMQPAGVVSHKPGGRLALLSARPAVTLVWCSYLSGARCRLAHGPADATVSCFSKIQTGFTFLVPAHLGSPGQRDVKRVCVCVSCIIRLLTTVC